jgi:hypothetical protein
MSTNLPLSLRSDPLKYCRYVRELALVFIAGLPTLTSALAEPPPGATSKCLAMFMRSCVNAACEYFPTDTEYWLYPDGRVVLLRRGKLIGVGTRELTSDSENQALARTNFKITYAGTTETFQTIYSKNKTSPILFTSSTQGGQTEEIGACKPP